MGRPMGSKNRHVDERVVADDPDLGNRVARSPEETVVAEPVEAAPARSRTEERRGERRRRDTEMDGHRMTLTIPPIYRDDKENQYRWANDDRSRLFGLTKQDDWDKCPAVGDAEDGANSVRRQVGTKKNGEPLWAHLVRKPKAYCEEDRAKQQADLDETMNQLAAGKRGDDANLGGEKGYIAADISIRDGRRP